MLEIPEFSDVKTFEAPSGSGMTGLQIHYSLSDVNLFFKKIRNSNDRPTFHKPTAMAVMEGSPMR